MPQIDLGKIRFDWRGTWSDSVAYELNDVVTDGTDVYVAIATTVPAATALSNSSYWDLMVAGVDTNYVDTQISNLIDAAPSALNTLNELAAALNDDANFATTVTNALSNKQDVVANVSSTEIGYLDGVTSAIQTQLNSKTPLVQPIESLTTSRALTSADSGKLLIADTAVTVTVQGLLTGQQVDFLQVGSGQITFAAGNDATLNSKDGKLKTAAQYSPASIKCIQGNNLYVLVGDLG